MASLAFGLAGAAAGSLIGMPGLGFALGSTLGTLLFPPGSDQRVEGSRLSDLTVQASTYGVPIPIVYGHARIAGNLIWATPIQETQTEEEQGGKGGGSTTTVNYTYSANAAIAFCDGPILHYRRIWADGKLIWDHTGGSTVEKYPDTIRAYLGDEDQLPDARIEADKGAGNVPAYRGLAYIVLDNFPLADFGNRIPNLTAEVCNPPESA
jgi:hypothetical protein